MHGYGDCGQQPRAGAYEMVPGVRKPGTYIHQLDIHAEVLICFLSDRPMCAD